jgi:hypothetical protein
MAIKANLINTTDHGMIDRHFVSGRGRWRPAAKAALLREQPSLAHCSRMCWRYSFPESLGRERSPAGLKWFAHHKALRHKSELLTAETEAVFVKEPQENSLVGISAAVTERYLS